MGTLWVFCFKEILAPCPDCRGWKAAETPEYSDQIMILSSEASQARLRRSADAGKLAPALRSQQPDTEEC